jgi:hypothetical protein
MSSSPINNGTVYQYQELLDSVYKISKKNDPQELRIAGILWAFDAQLKDSQNDVFQEMRKSLERGGELKKLEVLAEVITKVGAEIKQRPKSAQVSVETERNRALAEACLKYECFDNLPVSTKKAIYASRRAFMSTPRIFVDTVCRGVGEFFSRIWVPMSEKERSKYSQNILSLEAFCEKIVVSEMNGESLNSFERANAKIEMFETLYDLTKIKSRRVVKTPNSVFDDVFQRVVFRAKQRLENVDWVEVPSEIREKRKVLLEKASSFHRNKEERGSLEKAVRTLSLDKKQMIRTVQEYIHTLFPFDKEGSSKSLPMVRMGVCALLSESAGKVQDDVFIMLVNTLKDEFGFEIENLSFSQDFRTVKVYFDCSLDRHHIDLVRLGGLYPPV